MQLKEQTFMQMIKDVSECINIQDTDFLMNLEAYASQNEQMA